MTPALTRRRLAVCVFALALFLALTAGLIAVQLAAQAQGRGGKGGWEWAVPFAALLCLLPTLVYAFTLTRLARGVLPWPAWRVALWAALGGALSAAGMLSAKPLMRALGLGSDLLGGLVMSQLIACLLAALAAFVLARLATRRPPPP